MNSASAPSEAPAARGGGHAEAAPATAAMADGAGDAPVATSPSEPTPSAPRAPQATGRAPAPAGAPPASIAPPAGPSRVATEPAPIVQEQPGVKAGEWDDNANYREFQKYLATAGQVAYAPDITHRTFIVVRDADGHAMPQCRVTITGASDTAFQLRTGASGRAIFFPRTATAVGAENNELLASTSCGGATGTARFRAEAEDQVVDIRLGTKRAQQGLPVIDVAFVLDTTGSMSEEIASVKRTIAQVTRNLAQAGVRVRIGMVEYKDHGDTFVTKGYPLTEDVGRFALDVSNVSAGGGGDVPEAVEEGMSYAVNNLNWSSDAVSHLAFLIGDAPPHAERLGAFPGVLREAQRKGITFHTIAASGMDQMGQAFWRRAAQYTGGTNMFVLRGGAGPQSTGAGDPISSCGGTQRNYASGNLDQLILGKVQREAAFLRADPMRIPGLLTDENARPCDKRTTLSPLVAAK